MQIALSLRGLEHSKCYRVLLTASGCKASSAQKAKTQDTGPSYTLTIKSGQTETKASFEERVAEFDDTAYWKNHQPSLTEKADVSVAQALASPPPKVARYNPYEASTTRTTQCSESIPWIYITNPFRKVPKGIAVNEEAPPGEDGDWGKCKEVIVKKILDTAIECRCTSGKWMIFSPPSDVNEIWSAIAKSTSTNSLGIAAKVAPGNESALLQPVRLICIYTENFADKMDVYRVLKALRELGLVDKSQKRTIYYKADVYTYLELNSTNPYNIKASLYNSLDFLKNPPTHSPPPNKETKNVESFFQKVKKEPSDVE
ncbi:hypothetical protein EYC84_008816 [Monilinia fructicola]|uniref:DUF1917-domain-containing protein n=1 Tax=Monilinia fructicola TaxID=38448 RepID=A0A5M9JGE9_MONFR|nr:hypothetical protein EYC84_008816 [Monilinia fructicola]